VFTFAVFVVTDFSCTSETRFVPQNSKCCSEALESVG
jgi:hypothetical protein